MGKQRPKHGKGFTYTPEKTVNYETLVKEMFTIRNCGHLRGQLEITVTAFFAIPKSESKKKAVLMQEGIIRPTKKPDMDNILKIVCDALNGLAYKDDSQIVTAQVYKFYGDRPRVEVEIVELEG